VIYTVGENTNHNNKMTLITLESHPIGTTRVYKDNKRRIYAIKRTDINGWECETNAFKNNIWAMCPHGNANEWAHLVGHKDKKNDRADIIYLHLIA